MLADVASALLHVLLILLCVIGALLVLLLVMLSVRTGVEAVGVNGKVTVDLRYGLLRVPIWPFPFAKKEEQSQEKWEPRKRKRKKTHKKHLRFRKEELDIGELICFALELLDDLAGTLRFSRLRIRIVFGTHDAAQTAQLLGACAAFTGMIVPFLENTFDMHDYQCSADADFEADHTEWAFTVFCSLRPLQVIGVLLCRSRRIYQLYKKLFTKEEATNNE